MSEIEFLESINIDELKNKIEQFNQLDTKRLSLNELSEKLYDVLTIEVKGIETGRIMGTGSTYPANTPFYRIRPVDDNDREFPFESMQKQIDAWNPPADKVRIWPGRLNKEGESLLYVSPFNPEVCIEELEIEENKLFSLIKYVSIEEIKACNINTWTPPQSISVDANRKYEIINNFLITEFSKHVEKGSEHNYRTSEFIAKNFFDTPPEFQDCWAYTSVAMNPFYNVCFRPKVAKRKLKLAGVAICKYTQIDESKLINLNMVLTGFDENGNFLNHPIGSLKQIETFPEFK